MTDQDLSFAISVPIGAWHPFLRDCLSSLKIQEGPLEVALLDASNDPRVKDLADEFSPMLSYRRHGPDGGQSDAIIEGWKNTKSTMLGWLNADDILFPGALAAARETFRKDPELGLAYGHSTIVDDKKRTVGYHWAVEKPGPRILEGGIISQPSCFFRRDAYESIGGLDASLHYTMDWDLWIRLSKAGVKFGFIDDVLSMVLWAEGTKTSTFNKRRREELMRIIKDHAPEEIAEKTMRSFTIHNLVDRMPHGVRKHVVRALIRGRMEINGFGGDGLINDRAELYLVHYDRQEKDRLRITADNAGGIAALEVDGVEVAMSKISNKIITAVLPAPVGAGSATRLTFRIKQDARVWFTAAEWA